MKIVGILDYNITPGYDIIDVYRRNYRNNFFKKKGIELIVLDMDYYSIEKGIFTHYKEQFGEFEIIKKDIMPSVVWIKTSKDRERYLELLKDKTHIYPSSNVIVLAKDKRYTYKYFNEYQPKTLLLSSVILDISLIKEWGNEIIVKPRTGNAGQGVEKIIISDLIAIYKDKPYLDMYIVQELCDFSLGYPGLTDTYHDVRLVYIGGEFAYSELRYSYKDFRANVSLGGHCHGLREDDIPESVLVLGGKFLKKLGGGKSGLVSFDFGYDSTSQSWKLVEINGSPGFVPKEFRSNTEVIDIAYSSYANYFLSIK